MIHVHVIFFNGIVYNHERVISIENQLIMLHHYHVHIKYQVIQVLLVVIIYKISITQQLILNHTHSFVRNNRNSVLIHCKLNLLSSLNKFPCFQVNQTFHFIRENHIGLKLILFPIMINQDKLIPQQRPFISIELNFSF